MKIRNFAIILFLFSAIAFSCDNNDFDTPKKSDIPTFETAAEFQNNLSKVVQMKPEELREFENAKGYASFGRISEEFYRSIDMEKFQSIDEIKAFVKKNSNFLQLVEDENGELELETKFHNRADRYLQSADNMYQIEDNVFKVFETGIVSACSENIDLFYKYGNNLDSFMDDESFSFRPKNSEISNLKSTTANCPINEPFRSTIDRERLKVEVELSVNFWQDEVTYHFISRPYKRTLGVWYWCSRRMYGHCDVDWYYYDTEETFPGSGNFGNVKVEKTSEYFHGWADNISKYEQTHSETGDFIMDDLGLEPGFSKYDIWCDTDNVYAINEECGL